MKAFPFFIPEKKHQEVKFQLHTDFVNITRTTTSWKSFGGFFGGGYGRSARHSQLSGRLAGVPQHFLELLPQCLAIDASLFQDCMESFSGAAFQIQIQEVFVQKAVDGAEEGHE